MTPRLGPVVGVVGGGQLARMLAVPALNLGVRLRVLAMSPEESAAQVIPDVVLGSHTDLAALRQLAQGCDVVTFDHEHVPQDHLQALINDGVTLRPGPHALLHAQDKVAMRQRLGDAGLPIPHWAPVQGIVDVERFAQDHGWPVVLKTRQGGYDGRGVFVVDDAAAASRAMDSSAAQWLVEEFIAFDSEISAQVARSPHGQAVAYPVVTTVQIDGMCAQVVAPARELDEELAAKAQHVALSVAAELDVTGMLAVEMFVAGDRILINELAMRPHNSGHWTIEGARTSQFENHLRAILDLPLGDPSPIAPRTVMVNIVGGHHPDLYHAYLHCMAHDPGVKIHLYGKEVRPGRKVGHVTVVGSDGDGLLARAQHAADFMRGVIDG